MVIPGLEDLAIEELNYKANLHGLGVININKQDGGIEITADNKESGFLLNNILKIPTRILLRIAEFKAKDFPKLFKKLQKVNWNDYIPATEPLLTFSSKNSKLFDSRKVEKCFFDAYKKYSIANEASKKAKEMKWLQPAGVFIRIEDDLCKISIDTTGERLDKRGDKIFTTKAPIRQTIASAMFLFTKLNTNRELKAHYDPMAGSGTLSLESLNFYSLNQRNFSYNFFPKSHLLRKLESNQSTKAFKIYLNDISIDAINALKENLENKEVIYSNKDMFAVKDNFNDSFTLLNPPYNKRIKTEIDPSLYFEKIINHLYKENKVPTICCVIPTEFRIPNLDGLKIKKGPKFKNGGLNVRLVLFSTI